MNCLLSHCKCFVFLCVCSLPLRNSQRTCDWEAHGLPFCCKLIPGIHPDWPQNGTNGNFPSHYPQSWLFKGSAVDKVPNVAHNEPYESQSLLLWGKGTRQRLFYILSTSVIQILIIMEKTEVVTGMYVFSDIPERACCCFYHHRGCKRADPPLLHSSQPMRLLHWF